ncbi:hypothetical protein BH18ACI2_BH18ACI2_15620 [soil metagenome]
MKTDDLELFLHPSFLLSLPLRLNSLMPCLAIKDDSLLNMEGLESR